MVAPLYPFRLGQTGLVVEQMKVLFALAKRSGRTDELAESLRDITNSLQTDPLAFGDPWYNTQQDGGKVCHRVTCHLAVRYVVFKKEKTVTWLELRAHDNYWKRPAK